MEVKDENKSKADFLKKYKFDKELLGINPEQILNKIETFQSNSDIELVMSEKI